MVALLNSGYEADTPQLLVPIALARLLGLWPPPPTALEAVYETAGGPFGYGCSAERLGSRW